MLKCVYCTTGKLRFSILYRYPFSILYPFNHALLRFEIPRAPTRRIAPFLKNSVVSEIPCYLA